MLFNRKSLWTQIRQTVFMLGLINILPTFTEVVSAQNKPLSISQRPSVAVSQVSPREIEQMVDELQNLIYRVESTLITAEAQNTKYEGSMSAVVQELAKYRQYTNVSYTETKSNSRYSNNRAYEAIASAQQLLIEFPTLARQNFPQARRMWLDARRELWDNYPVDRPFAQSEIRAIWLDRGTIVKARSKADLEPLFNQMAEAGINTVLKLLTPVILFILAELLLNKTP